MGFRGSAKGTVGGMLKIIGNRVPGGPVIPFETLCLRFSASPCGIFFRHIKASTEAPCPQWSIGIDAATSAAPQQLQQCGHLQRAAAAEDVPPQQRGPAAGGEQNAGDAE